MKFFLSTSILFLMICGKVIAQPAVSFSITNNGQVKDLMERFYIGNELEPYTSHSYKNTQIKFELGTELELKNNWYFLLRGGVGLAKTSIEIIDGHVNHPKNEVQQNYYSFFLGTEKKINVEKLQVGVGFGVPFIILGDQKSKTQIDDPTQKYVGTTIYKGGFATGLNALVTVRYFMGDHFFMNVNASTGLLYCKVGGEIRDVIHYQDPIINPDINSSINFDASTMWRVTLPEVAFGVGIRL